MVYINPRNRRMRGHESLAGRGIKKEEKMDIDAPDESCGEAPVMKKDKNLDALRNAFNELHLNKLKKKKKIEYIYFN
jgi:hypothetical protein